MTAERRILRLVTIGLVVILATAFASWFLTNFERVKEVTSAGYSPEARRNRLLAAEHFLRRLGFEVESVAGRRLLDHLPSTNDTLVVPHLGVLNAHRRDDLRAWMESGGRLVTEADSIWDDSDSEKNFLEELGIRLFGVGTKQRRRDGRTEILAPQLPRPLVVTFQSRYRLELAKEVAPRGSEEAVVDGHIHVVRLRLGAGAVIAASDSAFMSNGRIGDNDHAIFLARLVAPPQGGKVWLVYDGSVPWFGALVWSAAPAVLVSGFLLIAFWVWGLGARLGPLIGVADRRRRDLLEHLDASGDFQWRYGRAAQLAASSTQRVLSHWLKRHPTLAQAHRHELVAAAAAATGESEERMTRALYTRSDTAAEFVAQSLVLQRLWRRAAGLSGESGPGQDRVGRRAGRGIKSTHDKV